MLDIGGGFPGDSKAEISFEEVRSYSLFPGVKNPHCLKGNCSLTIKEVFIY